MNNISNKISSNTIQSKIKKSNTQPTFEFVYSIISMNFRIGMISKLKCNLKIKY